MYATRNPNLEIFKTIFALDSNVMSQDSNGYTPLHWAAENNQNVEVVKALLKAGADKDARDADDKRALDYLEENEHISKDDYWKVRDMLY